MEAADHRAARLLTALEELVTQEEMYFRGGYYDLIATGRQRSGPLVADLVGLANQPGVQALRPRVEALQGRMVRHDTLLQAKLDELQGEIQRVAQARRRAARLAPAYARPAGRFSPRFAATG
jgi:hypothetical protein